MAACAAMNTGIWADDTLDNLLDFREHATEAPGFGMVYQADGEWRWMMIYPPAMFHKAMHPQRNTGTRYRRDVLQHDPCRGPAAAVDHQR